MTPDRRQLSRVATAFAVLIAFSVFSVVAKAAEPLPLVAGVELQPLKAKKVRASCRPSS